MSLKREDLILWDQVFFWTVLRKFIGDCCIFTLLSGVSHFDGSNEKERQKTNVSYI